MIGMFGHCCGCGGCQNMQAAANHYHHGIKGNRSAVHGTVSVDDSNTEAEFNAVRDEVQALSNAFIYNGYTALFDYGTDCTAANTRYLKLTMQFVGGVDTDTYTVTRIIYKDLNTGVVYSDRCTYILNGGSETVHAAFVADIDTGVISENTGTVGTVPSFNYTGLPNYGESGSMSITKNATQTIVTGTEASPGAYGTLTATLETTNTVSDVIDEALAMLDEIPLDTTTTIDALGCGSEPVTNMNWGNYAYSVWVDPVFNTDPDIATGKYKQIFVCGTAPDTVYAEILPYEELIHVAKGRAQSDGGGGAYSLGRKDEEFEGCSTYDFTGTYVCDDEYATGAADETVTPADLAYDYGRTSIYNYCAGAGAPCPP